MQNFYKRFSQEHKQTCLLILCQLPVEKLMSFLVMVILWPVRISSSFPDPAQIAWNQLSVDKGLLVALMWPEKPRFPLIISLVRGTPWQLPQ